jgi:hypothetical protein
MFSVKVCYRNRNSWIIVNHILKPFFEQLNEYGETSTYFHNGTAPALNAEIVWSSSLTKLEANIYRNKQYYLQASVILFGMLLQNSKKLQLLSLNTLQ